MSPITALPFLPVNCYNHEVKSTLVDIYFSTTLLLSPCNIIFCTDHWNRLFNSPPCFQPFSLPKHPIRGNLSDLKNANLIIILFCLKFFNDFPFCLAKYQISLQLNRHSIIWPCIFIQYHFLLLPSPFAVYIWKYCIFSIFI